MGTKWEIVCQNAQFSMSRKTVFEWSEKYPIFSILYSSVYPCPVPEGKSGQQMVDLLQKQVELLGAVKTGNFSVDCETYQSVNPTGPGEGLC